MKAALSFVMLLAFLSAGLTLAQSQIHPAAGSTGASAVPRPVLASPAPPPAAQPETAVQRTDPGSTPAWWTYLVPIVGPLISGLIAFEGVRRGLEINERNTARTIDGAFRTSEASNWQKANEAELRSIQAKVEGFYGPYTQVSEVNLLLVQDLQSRHQRVGFRLLIALFDEGWRGALSLGDTGIVRQIRDNGEQLEKLILEKAGYVEPSVLPYLARASVHFRILRLAHDRDLGEDPSPFERYVYPRSLDEVLEMEVERLNARMALLRARPTSEPPSMSELSGLPTLEPWISAPARTASALS